MNKLAGVPPGSDKWMDLMGDSETRGIMQRVFLTHAQDRALTIDGQMRRSGLIFVDDLIGDVR